MILRISGICVSVYGVNARSVERRNSSRTSSRGSVDRYARPADVQYIGRRRPTAIWIEKPLWLGNLAMNTISVPSGSDKLTDSPHVALSSREARTADWNRVRGELGWAAGGSGTPGAFHSP